MSVHVPNTPFGGKYAPADVQTLLREIYAEVGLGYDARTLIRMKDVRVTATEVEAAIESGGVTSYEVTPSRSELRLEVLGREGDMTKYTAVVYLSTNHRAYLCDIRDYKPTV
jgi:hypothetical protein